MADIFRKQFNAKIMILKVGKDKSSSHLTTERYRWIMHRLNELKTGDVKKTSKDYRLLKSYEISTSTIQDTVIQRLWKSIYL